MQLELTNSYCTLTREAGDKALYSERAVTYAMIQLLRAQHHDPKRVRGPQGLTSCPTASILRLAVGGREVGQSMLWHERYQVELSYQAFNAGKVTFQRVF